MNWFYVALAFVCVFNLLFLGLAAMLLYRILDATGESRQELIKAAKDTTSSARELMATAHRAVIEMERTNEAHLARDSSAGRVITELSRQIRLLGERFQEVQTQVDSRPVSNGDSSQQGADELQQALEQRAKLRAELNVALSKNKLLQEELSQTSYRLNDATARMEELRTGLNALSETKRSTVDNLIDRLSELKSQLEEARKRAKSAERLAEENAMRLATLQEQLEPGNHVGPAASTGPDHSLMIQDQQDQIDAMASRESALLARISAMEDAFKRTEAEKAFIEERYLQIDAGQDTKSN